MILRPYQAAAIESLRAECDAGRRRILFACPTGSGKTVTAAEIVRFALSYGNRVLFVVHLRELVDQTIRTLASLGIDRVGVMRGDDGRTDPDAPVQVASIQTLARRDRPPADVIILDEAHRSISESYVKNIWQAYPNATIVGLTATPCRGDGRPLGEWYEALVVGAKYSDLIDAKCISEPIVYAPRSPPDLSHVRKVAGDWNEGELEEEMAKIVGDIVPTWQAHAEGKRTIVFASGILHSKDIVRRFVEAGVTAEHLDGTTPGPEREAILDRLRTGETTVVSNCAVLTEGFDCPAIRCAIIARPTLSLVLHMQTAGRALRYGEERPVILDHAGNVGRHGMPHEDRAWKIDGPPVAPKIANPYKTCKSCFVYIPVAADACPHCGAEQPKKPRELPKEEAGAMVRVDAAALERTFFDAQFRRARSMGFKPGFAGFKFKEKFGRWPPWAWSNEVKASFAGDQVWQERAEQRAREREWAAEQANAEETIDDKGTSEGRQADSVQAGDAGSFDFGFNAPY